MTVSPLNTRIGKLVGECTVTYEVAVTRAEAIEYLVDAGADESEVIHWGDEHLLDAMVDPEQPYSDQVKDRLNDMSYEVDSTSTEWSVDR